MNEVKELEYWKNRCFESETNGLYLYEWKEALRYQSLFETGSYCGAKINELVNKYGYNYVVKKFDEAKASEKPAEEDAELERNGMSRCQ